MLYRQLGRTGLQVSAIALGCSGFWGSRQFSESQAAAIVIEAFERGVNLFDTGNNYSNFNAEPRLGRILRQILSRHPRSRLVISSKAGTVVPAGRPARCCRGAGAGKRIFRRKTGVRFELDRAVAWRCGQCP